MTQHHHLTTQDRLRFHLAWALTVAVFLSVGWTAMKSWDPRGPVSLLTSAQPLLMMIEVLALAAVASALATALAGHIRPDVGTFAVAVGLAVASVHGDNMTYLLLQRNGTPRLCALLAAEGLFWFAALAVAMIAAAVVVRWLGGTDTDASDRSQTRTDHARLALARMAAPAAPLAGRIFLPKSHRDGGAQNWKTGLKHLALASALTLILVKLLSAGAPDRAIRHGQACATVAIATYFAVRRAQAMFPVAATFWSLCSVPATCVLAFAIASLMTLDHPAAHLLCVPPSSFMRPLPITYIALGTAAALLACWSTSPTPSRD